jgi:hypothetical protein
MTKYWHLMRSSSTFLRAASIANDALTALNFLEASKGRVLKDSDRQRFLGELGKSLALLDDVRTTLESQLKGGTVRSESLMLVRAISKGYLTVRVEDLQERTWEAMREIEAFSKAEETDLSTAKEILNLIATTASGEIAPVTLKAK